jgi:hypothetical protein
MNRHSRREFLSNVGKGMFVAGLGTTLASELGLGLSPAFADEGTNALTFGELEPLVALLQETPATKLLPVLVDKLNHGTDLRRLTAAAALANARTFGGENYFGFHVFMALAPAYHMAQELPKERQALPLLKVLYRNAHYTEEVGGKDSQVLKPVQPDTTATGELLHKAVNHGDKAKADRLLAALAQRSMDDAFNALLYGVEDNHDVHHVVMPWRAWSMIDLVGKEHALTLLRQSVHQCAKRSSMSKPDDLERARTMVPKLLDKHRLMKGPHGKRAAEDAWVEQMCETILASRPDQAGEAVAMALAEGMLPEHIGEAISLASNQLVLRQAEKTTDKSYLWRTHGDSLGVHSSDTVNAWRNIIRVSNARHCAAGLILAAMDVSQSHVVWGERNGKQSFEKQPFPHKEHQNVPKHMTPDQLKQELHTAIRGNDQIRACALVHAAGQYGHEARPIFDVLLEYAISEDGRLHAEKYYRTVVEEFATIRPTFRWRQLTALARVSASSYGYSQGDKKEGRAPGYEEACKLLRV